MWSSSAVDCILVPGERLKGRDVQWAGVATHFVVREKVSMLCIPHDVILYLSFCRSDRFLSCMMSWQRCVHNCVLMADLLTMMLLGRSWITFTSR